MARAGHSWARPSRARPSRARAFAGQAFAAAYARAKRAAGVADFDDLIRLPVELFRNNDPIRDRWQRRLRYLLMDEYQDTNTCQYELVKLLVTGIGKKPMFTAVGDDDQAIYAWRGADIAGILDFERHYPEASVVALERNYRSSGTIVAAAARLVAHNRRRLAAAGGFGAAREASLVVPAPGDFTGAAGRASSGFAIV